MIKLFKALLLTISISTVCSETVNDTCVCIPQFQCTYKDTVDEDGRGVIDIRRGVVDKNPLTSRRKCDSYLEYCCLPSEIKPGYNESAKADNGQQNTGIKGPHVPKGCGHRNPKGVGFRITGAFNNEANFGEFPWTVAILKDKKINEKVVKVYACGGSLIHKRVVLTGAHCVFGLAASELTVRAGEWDTQTKNEPLPHQDRQVGVIAVHPDFRRGPLFNNYALLILLKSVDLADNVETICLPNPGETFDYSRCFSSGWGKDKFGAEGNYQVILKAVELPVVPSDSCQKTLRTTELGKYFKLHNSFICAGGESHMDTCTGDGGNPLVCPMKNDPTRYTQAGIVSWGLKCGKKGIPGAYADVTKSRKWIDETLRKYKISIDSFSPEATVDSPIGLLEIRGPTGQLSKGSQIVIDQPKNKDLIKW